MMIARNQPEDPFASPAVETIRRPDGAILFRSRIALGEYGRCVGDHLERWARQAPDRRFLVERDPYGAWQSVTYRQALDKVYAIGAWLLEQDVSTERPPWMAHAEQPLPRCSVITFTFSFAIPRNRR